MAQAPTDREALEDAIMPLAQGFVLALMMGKAGIDVTPIDQDKGLSSGFRVTLTPATPFGG